MRRSHIKGTNQWSQKRGAGKKYAKLPLLC